MNNVFYMGQLVAGADPFFFKVLRSGYAKDQNNVYQYGKILSGVDPFNFEPPVNNGMMIIPPPMPQPYPGTTIIHHSSPVPFYTSSMAPTYIHTTVPPPSPLMPILSTNTLAGHVDLPGRTIGGQYTRTNDSIDCCILI